MIYEPPVYEGKQQYVPVVSKNVDHLVGYLKGTNSYLSVMSESLASLGLDDINFDVNNAEFLDLSSGNYNDIMEDGRRESQLSKKEKDEYLEQIIDKASDLVAAKYADKSKDDSDVLQISCQCDMGHYFWKNYSDIPKQTFKCDICGRVLIHYTGIDDWEYTFDEGKRS